MQRIPENKNSKMPPKPENWTCRVLYDTNAVETPKPKRVKYHNKKPKGFSVTNQDIVKAGGHARAANGATASYTPIPKKGVRATVTHQEAVVQPSINTAPPISETAEEEFMLSDEQRNIYDAVVRDKKNVFFTGAAGTGKSYLLRSIISTLRKSIRKDEIAITASTGIAALNIKGCTFHRFAGVGLGQGTTEQFVHQIRQNPDRLNSWMDTKVLVIDEISMISADFFDKIEEFARKIRQNSEPFGGIQLILTGDFFQLPPVGKTQYTFEAECWESVVNVAIVLKKVFRQKDEKFAALLNDMRIGKMSTETVQILSSLSRNLKLRKPLMPAELYPVRQQVDYANRQRLNSLADKLYIFKSHDAGIVEQLKDCMAPRDLELKKGAQVMLIKNLSNSLVNGSIGIVEDFTAHEKTDAPSVEITGSYAMPIVRFSNGESVIINRHVWETTNLGEVTASRTQIPLILAWAMSIHKSQGQTIEYVKVDLMKVFERGQAYVALSRTTTLNNLQVLNFNPLKVKVDQRVADFYKDL